MWTMQALFHRRITEGVKRLYDLKAYLGRIGLIHATQHIVSSNFVREKGGGWSEDVSRHGEDTELEEPRACYERNTKLWKTMRRGQSHPCPPAFHCSGHSEGNYQQ
ncbi:hypothetical protein Q8A73_010335 [Channa argus]|nr:hypothetical protein Q8A73_010335 [Channa argus]